MRGQRLGQVLIFRLGPIIKSSILMGCSKYIVFDFLKKLFEFLF